MVEFDKEFVLSFEQLNPTTQYFKIVQLPGIG